MLDVLLYLALGVVIGLILAWPARRAAARVEAPSPPTSPPAQETANQLQERVLREAPQRFAEARRFEAIRLAMKCCRCDEPTAIVCETCQQRVCAGHRDPENHLCSGGAA